MWTKKKKKKKKKKVFEFVSTTWIKKSDWQKIRSGHGILIYSAWQGLSCPEDRLRRIFADYHGMIFANSPRYSLELSC